MNKKEIEEGLAQSWAKVNTLRDLKEIVQEIGNNVSGKRTQEMLYKLVDVVLELSEKVHDLELNLASYELKQEPANKEEKYRVDAKKKGTTDLYRQKRNPGNRVI